MEPQPTKRLWSAACIDLVIEEVGHRLIGELNMHPSASLPDQLHILNKQWVIWRRDPKRSNLRITDVT
jgi:hypothetical protein